MGENGLKQVQISNKCTIKNKKFKKIQKQIERDEKDSKEQQATVDTDIPSCQKEEGMCYSGACPGYQKFKFLEIPGGADECKRKFGKRAKKMKIIKCCSLSEFEPTT